MTLIQMMLTKAVPQTSYESGDFVLVDDGIIHIRPDAIQAVSEKKFGTKVCSEILFNSGSTVLVKQTISEVARLVNMSA